MMRRRIGAYLLAALALTVTFTTPAHGDPALSLVSDTSPGPASGGGALLTPLDGHLLFVAQTDGVYQPWSTDGVSTVRLEDDVPNPTWHVPSPMVRLATDLAVFWAWSSDDVPRLWRTDGTPAGTSVVAPMEPPAGTTSVSSAIGGVIYFGAAAPDAPDDVELWRTDGTPAGTYRVIDARAGAQASSPTAFAVEGTTVFFSANDGIHGRELWRTDGTAESTHMVIDARPGASSGFGGAVLPFGGRVLFTAVPAPGSGGALWETDGTETGTSEVFSTGAEWGPTNLTVVGDDLYFRANTPGEGYELWKTDGTTAGTIQVKDIAGGPASGLDPTDGDPGFVSFNGSAYFVANDGAHGRELWRSDGTAAGTYLVDDANPGAAAAVLPQQADHADTAMTVANGRLYFAADDGVAGFELWSTDGTESGTTMVADVNPGATGAYPFNLTRFNDMLLFVADDGVHGSELWKLELPPEPTVTPTAPPTATNTPEPRATPQPATCAWDVSGDGVVGSDDLALVAQHYGPAPGPPYDARYDIDGRGWVNAIDLLLVARHYGPCLD